MTEPIIALSDYPCYKSGGFQKYVVACALSNDSIKVHSWQQSKKNVSEANVDPVPLVMHGLCLKQVSQELQNRHNQLVSFMEVCTFMFHFNS